MTPNELVQKATSLSGLPPRKNKHGYGSLRWLAIQLDVNYKTVARWVHSDSRVPEWAVDRIQELEEKPWLRRPSAPSDAALREVERERQNRG